MKCPLIPSNEAERLEALSHYGLGPDRPLPSLDCVVKIALRMLDMPAAAVNMIGSDHVFFAASAGVGEIDMSREASFCAHAINQDGVMVVSDAAADERFHDNPLVTGPAHVRFYAGVPLRSPSGHAIGVLCILDSLPHADFPAEDRERLRELAQMATDRLELRRIEIAAACTPAPVPTQPGGAPENVEELSRLSCYDFLTGLINRGQFCSLVVQALARSQPATLLMIDLVGFKDLNDTQGHAIGDGVLREVAIRLRNRIGTTGTVARIGGDEFGIVLPAESDPAKAAALAHSLIADIAKPIIIGGREARVSASCGVALSPLHSVEPMELIGDADLALFQAKRERGGVFVFTQALRAEAAARNLYCMELYRAVDNGEFLLFYQPQVRLSDGALTGAEALLRWRHPERGLQSPAAFLPALESGPLAASVGSWVIDEACSQAAFWRRNGADQFRIGVNLFGAQFHAGDLASDVMATLDRHGLAPHALELEITENIVLDQDEVLLDTLRRLRSHGVGIAFDDFGTGFASLSLLKIYPLSRIKIDQCFVQGMLSSPKDASVVRAVLDMARSFGLETIAEGIETQPQRDDLLRQACEEGQGYLFGRPIPAQQFAEAFRIGPQGLTLSA